MLIGKVAGAVAAEIIDDALVCNVRGAAQILVAAAGHGPPCIPAATLARTLDPVAPLLEDLKLFALLNAAGPGLGEDFVFRGQPQVQRKPGLPMELDLDAFPGG